MASDVISRTETQTQAAVVDMPRLQMREIMAGRWRCCYNCAEWRNSQELCHKFAQRPPVEVLVVGCAEWFAEGIPF